MKNELKAMVNVIVGIAYIIGLVFATLQAYSVDVVDDGTLFTRVISIFAAVLFLIGAGRSWYSVFKDYEKEEVLYYARILKEADYK